MEPQLVGRAKQRAAISGTGIGASFEQNVTPPDQDGWRCRMIVSDGDNTGEVDVNLSGSERLYGYEIPVIAVMRVLERRAGNYPVEQRLELLLQQRQLILGSDDFRDSDFEPNPDPTSTP
jgi:hypothetical protein